jgi:metallo-beta-lactamase family protein
VDLTFLGGANTVTGSRYLLTTPRAQVLIDCGMFQGSPNESVRNRVPLGFDTGTLDAILITHAHLDHCGLLPVAVREGYKGPIYLTTASGELATLVLLDSGRLHEEFAKRQERWERRHPEKAASEEREAAEGYLAAVEEARQNEARSPDAAFAGDDEESAEAGPLPPIGTTGSAEQVETTIEAVGGTTAPNPETALRTQPPALNIDLDAPLYTEADARAVLPLFQSVRYDRELEVAPGVWATFLDAGHILGSAIIRLRVQEADGGAERTIVFSGDLGRPDTPILRDPTVLTDADYVCVESTYGGREHEPSDEAVRILTETIREVAAAKGVLLVPSFAIGRTQEIVWELDRLIDGGEIPLLPLFLDSPMASKASDIYRRHPEFYDEETRAILERGGSPLDYPNQTITNDVKASQAIARSARPYMIIASNGMLTGGRVVSHLRNLIGDPGATLLFVGYQGEGTLGAHLQAGVKTVKLNGEMREVRCRVRSISGFSAHADESELLDWLASFGRGRHAGDAGFPKQVFLVHGDPEAQVALAPKVTALGFDVHVPHWHERVQLD